jgi:hypothetical protein
VIISSRAMNSPDGRQFSVVTFTEISERKRAEEQLRKANKQLEERQKEMEAVRTIGGDFGLAGKII